MWNPGSRKEGHENFGEVLSHRDFVHHFRYRNHLHVSLGDDLSRVHREWPGPFRFNFDDGFHTDLYFRTFLGSKIQSLGVGLIYGA